VWGRISTVWTALECKAWSNQTIAPFPSESLRAECAVQAAGALKSRGRACLARTASSHDESRACPGICLRSIGESCLACKPDEDVCAVQAADALTSASCTCAGKAYFITNAEPRRFWGFLGDILEPLGYQRPSTKLPWRLIFFIAILVELIIWLLKPMVVSIPFHTYQLRIYACHYLSLDSTSL